MAVGAAATGQIADIAGVKLHVAHRGIGPQSAADIRLGEVGAGHVRLPSQMPDDLGGRELAGLMFGQQRIVRSEQGRRRQGAVQTQLDGDCLLLSQKVQMVERLEQIAGDMPAVIPILRQQILQRMILRLACWSPDCCTRRTHPSPTSCPPSQSGEQGQVQRDCPAGSAPL